MADVAPIVNFNDSKTSEKPINQQDADEIGHAFVQQYYVTLSDFPEKVFQFYGADSTLSFNNTVVKGHDEIKETIQKVGFKDCKVRIFSVIGNSITPSILAFQVCGELALQGHPPRRFFQTFVLVSPISKSFYAQCGLFQWVDEAFAANLKTSASEDNLLNGDTVRVNQDTKKFGEKENTLVYKEYHHQNGGSEIKDEPKTMAVNASKPQNLQQPAQTITEPDSKALAFESDLKEPLNANKPEIKIEDRGQKDPIQPNKRQQPQEHQGKKTWANVATNQPAPVANRKSSPPPKQPQQQRQNELQKGTSQQGNKDQRPQQQQQQYNKQPYRKPQDQQNQQPFDRSNNYRRPQYDNNNFNREKEYKEPENVIYFSLLEKVNENPNIREGEKELRTRLEEITSGVESVIIKYSTTRKELKYGLGKFIFKTKEDIDAVYKVCLKDNDQYKFHVSVPSFNFDGEIILSSSKTTSIGQVIQAGMRQGYNQQNRNFGNRYEGGNSRFYEGGNQRYDGNYNQNRDRDYNPNREYNQNRDRSDYNGYTGNRQNQGQQGNRGNFHFVNRGGYRDRSGTGGGYGPGPRRNSFNNQYQFRGAGGNSGQDDQCKDGSSDSKGK